MNPTDETDRKIIIEFCHLLEKSKVLFNGLRELPQYGYKQWQSYFGRTFDVYTKLWKFQQQHRYLLDRKYGLKRWQIGEIASKIGQLYYHFYLRTSETAYLREAFSFYQAIRGRRYYTHALIEDRCELVVKKLRYYARFIVVALLMNRLKVVDDLVRELDNHIVEYGSIYNADDQIEWNVVVDEVKGFLDVEPAVQIIYSELPAIDLKNRINPYETPYIERNGYMHLSLQDVIIVGSRYAAGDSFRRDNPHKYLLFKPSAQQLLVYLASSCNDLPPNGAIMLYISADGSTANSAKSTDSNSASEGGFITSGKQETTRDSSRDSRESRASQPQTISRGKDHALLYPGDLNPFTRRPLFIIIESNCSHLMQNISHHFNQPLVILLSAQELPSCLNDRNYQGNLLTLFLHNPLMGFCTSCELYSIEEAVYNTCYGFVLDFLFQCAQLILRVRIDTNFFAFLGDDFLKIIILRFIFCECSLRLNRNFRSRNHLVRSVPSLPDELLSHATLVAIVLRIADHLGVKSQFLDVPVQAPGPAPRDQN
ncbi:unnamed protein product [Leptidea sinapis]|uniref:Protein SCAI n=1 Tax=Leptidea sinapis TaxID=189913 RepID=A0A5E4PMT2_9NEOP|nr:unnamed protein product [Leptidea sinapis]